MGFYQLPLAREETRSALQAVWDPRPLDLLGIHRISALKFLKTTSSCESQASCQWRMRPQGRITEYGVDRAGGFVTNRVSVQRMNVLVSEDRLSEIN